MTAWVVMCSYLALAVASVVVAYAVRTLPADLDDERERIAAWLDRKALDPDEFASVREAFPHAARLIRVGAHEHQP